MTHTPTPWAHNGLDKRYQREGDDPENWLACAVWAENGETPVCSTNFSVGKYNEVDPETRAGNAKLIVRAVNSHADLVAALEAMVQIWNDNHMDGCEDPDCPFLADYNQARAAIAKAKEG